MTSPIRGSRRMGSNGADGAQIRVETTPESKKNQLARISEQHEVWSIIFSVYCSSSSTASAASSFPLHSSPFSSPFHCRSRPPSAPLFPASSPPPPQAPLLPSSPTAIIFNASDISNMLRLSRSPPLRRSHAQSIFSGDVPSLFHYHLQQPWQHLAHHSSSTERPCSSQLSFRAPLHHCRTTMDSHSKLRLSLSAVHLLLHRACSPVSPFLRLPPQLRAVAHLLPSSRRPKNPPRLHHLLHSTTINVLRPNHKSTAPSFPQAINHNPLLHDPVLLLASHLQCQPASTIATSILFPSHFLHCRRLQALQLLHSWPPLPSPFSGELHHSLLLPATVLRQKLLLSEHLLHSVSLLPIVVFTTNEITSISGYVLFHRSQHHSTFSTIPSKRSRRSPSAFTEAPSHLPSPSASASIHHCSSFLTASCPTAVITPSFIIWSG